MKRVYEVIIDYGSEPPATLPTDMDIASAVENGMTMDNYFAEGVIVRQIDRKDGHDAAHQD